MQIPAAQFLTDRLTGLGGSDIGAILGVNHFKTPLDVYLSKVDPQPEESDNEFFYWGHAHEYAIARRFERDHKESVIRNVPIARHPKHDWMIANVDGIIAAPDRGVLEIKTVSAFSQDGWGEEGSDQVPLSYVAQCAWYMAVMGYDYAVVAALFGGNKYKEYRIERDLELEATLIAKGKEFWFENVVKRIPPEPKTSGDIAKMFQRDIGTTIEADDDIFKMCVELRGMKDRIKQDEDAIEDLQNAIKIYMKDAGVLMYCGQLLNTWKSSKDSVETDYKAICDALNAPPCLIAANTTTNPGARRFLLKKF